MQQCISELDSRFILMYIIFCRSFCFFVVVIADAMPIYIRRDGKIKHSHSLSIRLGKQAAANWYCCFLTCVADSVGNLCVILRWDASMRVQGLEQRAMCTLRRILIILSCGLKLSAIGCRYSSWFNRCKPQYMTMDRRSI